MSDKPTNVRFSADVLRRLDRAADRFGLTKTAFVKMAVALFLDDFEKRGESSLPRDWQDILRNLDGRSHRYKSSIHQDGGVGNSAQINHHPPTNEIRKRNKTERKRKPRSAK